MKISRLVGAALAASTIAGSAIAADLPSRNAPPIMVSAAPYFTWTGFYVGMNGGYGFAAASRINGASFYTGNYPATIPGLDTAYTGSNGVKGILAGGQAGFNYQMGGFVVGIETDLQSARLFSSASGGPLAGNPAFGFIPFFSAFNTTQSVNWFGTLRGRAGFALDRALIYATGGLAYGGVNNSLTYTTVYPTAPASFVGATSISGTRLGWTAGAGVEYAIGANWTLKAEYLYTDLGTTKIGTATAFGPAVPVQPIFLVSQTQRTAFHTLRGGINYKFGWGGPSAVVARY